tara:strand:+ start:341 stop:730 length:390 start_codon:yes stop_codon:yes gene_type:complete
MVLIELSIKHINDSLQVGDLVYATATGIKPGAFDKQAYNGPGNQDVGVNRLVGTLSKIETNADGNVELYVDNAGVSGVMPSDDDFIMFCKHKHHDAGVAGYYANASFVNNSTEKAELFAVSSEVIINSK